MSSLLLRLRAPSGQSTVTIAADAPLSALFAQVAEATATPIEALALSSGFPPKRLESGDEPILDDKVQPAFFHPEWTFEGVPAHSALHYEKRAPLPVINLLRRADLDDVVATGLQAGRIVNQEIAEHNAAELERQGQARLQTLFAKLSAGYPAKAPTSEPSASDAS